MRKYQFYCLFVVFVVVDKVRFAESQDCRYVTVPVCREESGPSDTLKGEPGVPGKAGPIGAQGPPGEKGDVGDADALERKFASLIKELNETLHRSTTCRDSSKVGYQTLRSGEKLYCDGGWIVFQRRFNGSVDFSRTWQEYKDGFGDPEGEFWMGLEKLFQMINGRGCRMRVDLWDFDNDHAYAEYSAFSIEDESDFYRLHIAGYSGTAGNAITRSDHTHDGMAFTTKDSDHDLRDSNNCATDVYGISGGWWFRNCQVGKLNAAYGPSTGSWHGNVWHPWKGSSATLKASTMKVRCD